ncbi:MAG: hypothetical protein CMM89_04195 [Rickettsiales bacterium]|nr:hypothetical protein [Rickettsiales bacterium]OUT44447.1 MAG: hypothetical protein CBB73_04090 [Pelagibacteraceae bacterium TMED13]|tara:strand:- start:17221 stop:17646 length:426 start_codon:yes stop_codon:yes gene_type:complete
MNKKRKINDVLESIFNLIQDAHNELDVSEKDNEIKNNLIIEKKNSININKGLIEEKLDVNPKSRTGDWSNLEFKKIELNKVDNIKKDIESKKDNLKNNFSDDDVKKIFLDSLNNWRKKNLKNLTENIYQEFIKETLKDKLK